MGTWIWGSVCKITVFLSSDFTKRFAPGGGGCEPGCFPSPQPGTLSSLRADNKASRCSSSLCRSGQALLPGVHFAPPIPAGRSGAERGGPGASRRREAMCGRTACSLGAARLRRACAYRDRQGRRQQPEWLREGRYRPSYNKGPQSSGPVLLSRKHVQQVTGGASAGARPPGGWGADLWAPGGVWGGLSGGGGGGRSFCFSTSV